MKNREGWSMLPKCSHFYLQCGGTAMTSQDLPLPGFPSTLELGDLRLSLYTQPAAGLFARWRKPLTLVRISSPTFTADFPSGEVIALEHGPIVCESANGDSQSVGFLASPSVIHKDSAVGEVLSGQVFPDGALLFLKGSDLIAVFAEEECNTLIRWLRQSTPSTVR